MKQNNLSAKIKLDESKHKIWIEKGNIICVRLAKTINEQEVEELFERIEKTLRKVPGKAKILVDMDHTSIIRSSQFRKNMAGGMKNVYENFTFSKIAIFGGNIIMRTIASFIITASRLKNIKAFETKEEATKWFKGP